MLPNPQSALDSVVHSDPARLGGTPVFRGTRVPVKALFDYLQAGKTVHQFLGDFEGVPLESVKIVLQAAEEDVLRHVHAA